MQRKLGITRLTYDDAALQNLFAHRNELTLAEQVGLLDDLKLLADTGAIPFNQTLALVPKLKDDPYEQVVVAGVGLATLRNQFIPRGLRDDYSRFVEHIFGERGRRLGWMPKSGESEDVQLLRAKLVPFVAIIGRDEELTREAKRLAPEWLRRHDVISPDVAEGMLAAAARDGDATLFDELLKAAKSERDPSLRPLLVRTLGAFRDKALLERAFRLAFDGTFDVQRILSNRDGALRRPGTRRPSIRLCKGPLR